MVRRKLPGTEWSGSILNKRKNEWREVVSAASLFCFYRKKEVRRITLVDIFQHVNYNKTQKEYVWYTKRNHTI